MKISIDVMQKLSKIKNSVYDDIKIEYLYHSNKLEGSTFNIEQLNILLEENMVIGEHSIDDVQETINSLELFDFVVETLKEKLTDRLLREYHSILKKNTSDENYGFVGIVESCSGICGHAVLCLGYRLAHVIPERQDAGNVMFPERPFIHGICMETHGTLGLLAVYVYVVVVAVCLPHLLYTVCLVAVGVEIRVYCI